MFLRDRQAFHDLPGRHVAQADVAHLARAHHVIQRGKHFLQRREGIEAVQLVQVDVVKLQPFQACVHFVHQVLPRLRFRAKSRTARCSGARMVPVGKIPSRSK